MLVAAAARGGTTSAHARTSTAAGRTGARGSLRRPRARGSQRRRTSTHSATSSRATALEARSNSRSPSAASAPRAQRARPSPAISRTSTPSGSGIGLAVSASTSISNGGLVRVMTLPPIVKSPRPTGWSRENSDSSASLVPRAFGAQGKVAMRPPARARRLHGRAARGQDGREGERCQGRGRHPKPSAHRTMV